jgi:hypothetical protein
MKLRARPTLELAEYALGAVILCDHGMGDVNATVKQARDAVTAELDKMDAAIRALNVAPGEDHNAGR